MRQQNNTLHDFLVLMTEKGVVPVDDPQQIAVYDCLCAKGKLRPIEIAESLGCPSSSLHFVLEKMLDNGIIVKSKPDPVRKEVFYSVLSTELMRYVPPTPEQVSESEEVFKNPQSYFAGLSSVSNMLEAYLTGMGLDYAVIRKNYVKDLADSIKGTIGTGSLDDVVPVIKEVFGSITTYRMGIFSLSPLTVVLEGDRTIRSKLDTLADFICCMVENATGKTYALESIEDFSNDDNCRYKVTMVRVADSTDTYLNTSLPQQNDPNEFFLLDVDGQASMLAGDIQVKILKAVYDRPLCVSDVTSVVDLPRSTVTTNLLRMLEDGIVSVFYAENGAIYYGLNCAVLMLRNRKIAKDHARIREALRKASENGFMEGYLLYTLAYLQELGFDTSYVMVSLGAKYMRAVGKDSPKNFDAYFERISSFGAIVGLSMTVTSVYPLTIGVSKTGDLPGPMMSFAKGMVHQGLEMASSGMFLRVSEEDDNEVKVSFKEIYPPISATPPAGMDAEALESAVTEKKRTSSVRAAIRNRSIRSGKPSKTMRYISSVALFAILAVAVLFAVGAGNGDVAYADVCALDVDSSDIVLYDTDGNEIALPYVGKTNTAVTFSIEWVDAEQVGVVKNGIAYPIDQAFITSNNGLYTAVLDRNITITELRLMTVSDGLTANLYDFGKSVTAEEVHYSTDYIPAGDYMTESGDLWVSKDTWVMVTPVDGYYISVSGNDTFYFDRVVVGAWELLDMTAVPMPNDYATLTIEGAYEAMGCYVADSIKVQKDAPMTMKFITTDGPISITLDEGGRITPLMVDEDRCVTVVVAQDAELEYNYVRIK